MLDQPALHLLKAAVRDGFPVTLEYDVDGQTLTGTGSIATLHEIHQVGEPMSGVVDLKLAPAHSLVATFEQIKSATRTPLRHACQ